MPGHKNHRETASDVQAKNTFELRLIDETSGATTDLDAEIWVDGQLIDEPHCIDLPQLVHSIHEPGWYEIFTCGCGVGGCAGIVEGIHVTHVDRTIQWCLRRPQSAGNLLEPALSKWEASAVPVSFEFEKRQMLAALETFLETVRVRLGSSQEHFEWAVHGFYIQDLLRLDPYKPYFDRRERG